MKRLLLALIIACSLFVVFELDFASADPCTPSSGYDDCYVSSNSQYSAYSEARVQETDLQGKYDGRWYYDDSAPWTVRCDGDNFYLYDFTQISKSEAYSSCDRNGCSGAVTQLPTGQAVEVDVARYSPMIPGVICHDYDEASDGAWSYSWQSIAYSSTYYEIVQECSVDTDCLSDESCNIVSQYERTCDQLTCGPSQYVEDHQCVTPEFPKICSDAGITDLAECQSYVNDYLAVLEGDLQDKVDTINQLQLTIDEKQAFINELNATIEEKAQIISELEMTLEEQADTISQLTQKAEEQAQYIEQLTQNIDEQAALIDQLESNLARKAALINELRAENEYQADLISKFNASLEEQGQIITELNNTVQDDAVIISRLTNKTDEQAVIIANMRQTNEEQRALIAELRDSLEEEEELRVELQRVVERQQNIISRLQSEAEENVALRWALLLGGLALGAGGTYGYVWYRRRRR